MGVEAARARAARPPTRAARRAVVLHGRRRPTSTRPTPPPSTPRCGSTATSPPSDFGGARALGDRRAAGRARRGGPAARGHRRHPHRPARRRRRGRGRRRRRRAARRRRRPTARCSPSSSARARATEEFLDRWRTPGDVRSKVWEERFGETQYVPLGVEALRTPPSTTAGIDADQRRPPVVAGTARPGRHAPSAKQARRRRPTRSSTTSPRPSATPARAQASLLLRAALEQADARPGDRAVVAGRRRRRAGLPHHRRRSRRTSAGRARRRRRSRPARRSPTASSSPGAGCCPSSRPAGPSRPARRRRPPAAASDWKFGFVGSATAPRRRPPAAGRVSMRAAPSTTWSRADGRRAGTIVTFTDRQARLLAEPAGRVRGRRLRRRRPAARRAHRRRRRPTCAIGDRGRDDVPPAVHRRRHPQLLLEGPAGPRQRPPIERGA